MHTDRFYRRLRFQPYHYIHRYYGELWYCCDRDLHLQGRSDCVLHWTFYAHGRDLRYDCQLRNWMLSL